jgi:hypothetical protein
MLMIVSGGLYPFQHEGSKATCRPGIGQGIMLSQSKNIQRGNNVRASMRLRLSVTIYACLALLFSIVAVGCKITGEINAAAPGPADAGNAANVSAAPPSTSPVATADDKTGACRLLSSADIEAVQGEAVKETKGSEQGTDQFQISQCYYSTPHLGNSVSLAVTEKKAGSRGDDVREYWKEKFKRVAGKDRDSKKEKDRSERDEKEEGQPLRHVEGVGDDAYWEGDKRVGALYVLKGDRFLRISIGGSDEVEVKINKVKRLAQQAIRNL